MSRTEWQTAIEADGGHVITVEDSISSYSITPAYVGFDHVDMIDFHLAGCKARGWTHQPTIDALLDARSVWAALERKERNA